MRLDKLLERLEYEVAQGSDQRKSVHLSLDCGILYQTGDGCAGRAGAGAAEGMSAAVPNVLETGGMQL